MFFIISRLHPVCLTISFGRNLWKEISILRLAVREGIYEALQCYGSYYRFADCLDFWDWIFDPDDLASLPSEIIYSGGFQVETMETVVWALRNGLMHLRTRN